MDLYSLPLPPMNPFVTLLRRTLAGAALFGLAAGAAPSAHAAFITVNAFAADGDTDDDSNGDCTLREAVEAANTDTAVDGCAAGSGADDIIFDPGVTNPTIELMNGELLITDDLNIEGQNGANSRVTIDANYQSRVIRVGFNTTLDVSNAVIMNGRADLGGGIRYNVGTSGALADVAFMLNRADVSGGALYNGGAVTVTGGEFTSNRALGTTPADGGGAIFNRGTMAVSAGTVFTFNKAIQGLGNGGAIFNQDNRTLSVNSSGGAVSFVRNQAARAGGAIESGGDLTLEGVTFQLNRAEINGGGLHMSGDATTVSTGGTVVNNRALKEGGGYWNSADGTLTVNGTDFFGNVASGEDGDQGGGGIFSDGGDTDVTNGTFLRNKADAGSGSGGGIQTINGAALTVTGTTFTGNQARRAGGGVEVAGGSAVITNALFDGNTVRRSPGNGGGLHVGGVGQGTVSQSTFSGNSAAEGGGLWNSGFGTLNVNNSTVSGNAATGEGGGVYTVGGGATTLESVTVAENTAGTNGGGLGIGVDDVSSVSLNNTIVGDNTAAGQGNDCFGSYTTNGFLLIEDPSNCEIVGADENTIFGEDPQLGPLMDNGGPTLTHALLLTSPAVDAGQSAFAVDQRDVPRSDDQDDLGAFERGDGGALACSTASPLSFDFDGDGESSPTSGQGNVGDDDFDALGTGDLGEFVGLRNEGGPGGEPAVDLSEGCTFVVFDAIAEEVTYVDGFSDGQTVVAAGDSLVIANMGGDRMLPAMTLPDGPGAFALVTGPAMVGDGPELFAPAEGSDPSRVVAAVVYGRDREVFGSIQGRSTAAELAAFREAMAAAFGGATDAEGGPDGLAVRAWPNPTSGAATVSFGLAEAGDVTVAVYDALGRQVAVVADGAYGPGQHEAAVPSLPAGVYAVRVLSRGEARTARLTVAR